MIKKSIIKTLLSAAVGGMLMALIPVSAQADGIGVAWIGKSGMTNRVVKGFEARMQDIAPGLDIEWHKELASSEELAQVVAKFESEKKGMVILRSTGAKFLAQNPPSIPAFFGGCNHPVALGVLKNMNAPEGNVTGVTYALPADGQFEIFQAMIPAMKSVYLLTGKGNPSGPIDVAETQGAASARGIDFQYGEFSNKDEVIDAVKANRGKVSVFIIGSQAQVMDNAAEIIAAAGNTPVFAYSEKPVKAGALGGFVANDEKLGGMLADSVVSVVVKGTPVKEVSVKVDPEPKFFMNEQTIEMLALVLPYSVIEIGTLVRN